MKTKCVTNSNGYEHELKVGKEYEVLDVCVGIFAGDHYVTVSIGEGKKTAALLHRFDMTKQEADDYIQQHPEKN